MRRWSLRRGRGGHLNNKDMRRRRSAARTSSADKKLRRTGDRARLVRVQRHRGEAGTIVATGGPARLPLEIHHIRLTSGLNAERDLISVLVQLRYEDVAVLVDAHRGTRGRVLDVSHEVLPLAVALLRVAATRRVVGTQTSLARDDPHLDEAQRGVAVVAFAVRHSSSSGHKLHRSASQRLAGGAASARRPVLVPVRELTLHHVRCDFHIAVRMGTEHTVGLHQVVVEDTQNTKAHGPSAPLREREVKARAQPVL
mmetsp:Transcript_16296/g.18679  ORF Transcript_16296/g.18679 Transcript_16296/m.18679 type:complete len:255 (-) Transcript_16296:189-953(-)